MPNSTRGGIFSPIVQ